MSWFKKLLPKVMTSEKKGVPEGLWSKCPSCQAVLYRLELERNLFVCTKCDHHLRLNPEQRFDMLLDQSPRETIGSDIETIDMLKFRDTKKYKDRLHAAIKRTHQKEALSVVHGAIMGREVVVACFNFSFIGGTMSAGVGKRFVLAVEAAIAAKCPFICFTASGGARMQEGLFSLMQMARTSAALTRLSDFGLPYISVMTDPTMGGVSASLATLGDLILAESGALIGFSGPRVIQQTIGEKLPEGFQRSDFLLKHGAVDQVVHRRDMKTRLNSLMTQLSHHLEANQ